MRLLSVILGAFLVLPALGALPPMPCATSGQTYQSCSAPWRQAGPAGYRNKSERTHAISAAETITYTNGSYFLGMVNGGVWKTNDLLANGYTPHWEVVSDSQFVRCSSISAMASLDGLVVVGCGASTSSEMGADWNEVNSGDWGGVFYSPDSGKNWVSMETFINSFVSHIIIVPQNQSPSGKLRLVVSVRSHFERKNDGGIYFSDDMGKSWTKTYSRAVFNLAYYYDAASRTNYIYAALPIPKDVSVVRSSDAGVTWENFDKGISFTGNHVPFYPKMDIKQKGSDHVVVYVALTVNQQNTSDTYSDMFQVNGSTGVWKKVANMPQNLDEDNMPKDRCAVMHDPDLSGIAYVVGNANSICYRVHLDSNKWEKMWALDTKDFSQPHVDCRAVYWEPIEKSLIVLSDGGIFLRLQPQSAGGYWTSLGGDNTALEIYNIGWDNRNSRWVAGAQDNSVVLSEINSPPDAVGDGVVGGDGTQVFVDNTHCPARLYGCAQFLGGWQYLTGSGDDIFTNKVPFSHYFSDLKAIPFFLTWYQVNRINPDSLLFAVNDTRDGVAGLWQFYPIPGPETSVPLKSAFHSHMTRIQRYSRKYGITDLHELKFILGTSSVSEEHNTAKNIDYMLQNNAAWPAPTLVAATPESMIYVFAAGSHVNGHPDAEAMAAMNNTHLFIRSSDHPEWDIKPLPMQFVEPVDWTNYYNNDKSVVIGPISHGKTTSIALSLKNNNVVAVTGWPHSPLFNMNAGREGVFVTLSGGDSWTDVTGDLIIASDTTAKARPAGLEFVDDIDDSGTIALLAGTVNGVFVTFLEGGQVSQHGQTWSRLGQCSDLPLVLVPSVKYEPYSDTLVVGTFGRGVYVMSNAKDELATRMAQTDSCSGSFAPAGSNAGLLPPQQSC